MDNTVKLSSVSEKGESLDLVPFDVRFWLVTASKTRELTILSPSLVCPLDFDAIFYVGGHGPVIDLPVDQDSIKLIQDVRSIFLVCSSKLAQR